MNATGATIYIRRNGAFSIPEKPSLIAVLYISMMDCCMFYSLASQTVPSKQIVAQSGRDDPDMAISYPGKDPLCAI